MALGDVPFVSLVANLRSIVAELGFTATVRDVRQTLANRLGLSQDALDDWSLEISSLVDATVRRQCAAEEQVALAPIASETTLAQPAASAADGVGVAGVLDVVDDVQAQPAAADHAEGAGNQALEQKKTFKRLYFGTWSHTGDADKKAPDAMDKAVFGELLVVTCDSIFSREVKPPKRAKTNKLLKLSVWEEAHRDGHKHYHFPLLAENPWYVGALRRALQTQGIYVHFSAEHEYYWSSIVYVAVPSTMPGGKGEGDIDQAPWFSPNHPSLQDTLADIPRGARACDKARVRRFLGEASDVSRGSSSLAVTDKEFTAFILHHNIRSQTELLAWVRTQSEKAVTLSAAQRATFVGIEAYCYRNQVDLVRRVGFAWDVADAPKKIALRSKSAWDMVVEACELICVCAGEWAPRTEGLLQMQCAAYSPAWAPQERPESLQIRRALVKALQLGAQKHTNIFLYGPNTSGKSHVLKPLLEIFAGCVFVRPVGKGNYPLQDIFGAKVCVLQDVRVNTFKLSWDDLLVWFEGETFTVPFPRNTHSKDLAYSERAPVFVSTGNKFCISDVEAQQLRVNPMEQNDMMAARFRFFLFPRSLGQHEKKVTPTCARCFARWLCSEPSSQPGGV